jgi:hypothetical protein
MPEANLSLKVLPVVTIDYKPSGVTIDEKNSPYRS